MTMSDCWHDSRFQSCPEFHCRHRPDPAPEGRFCLGHADGRGLWSEVPVLPASGWQNAPCFAQTMYESQFRRHIGKIIRAVGGTEQFALQTVIGTIVIIIFGVFSAHTCGQIRVFAQMPDRMHIRRNGRCVHFIIIMRADQIVEGLERRVAVCVCTSVSSPFVSSLSRPTT